jgi:hypothetical protein
MSEEIPATPEERKAALEAGRLEQYAKYQGHVARVMAELKEKRENKDADE